MSSLPRGARRLAAVAVAAVAVAVVSPAVTATAAPTSGVLVGTVTGADGNPLQGVIVQAGSVQGITPPYFAVDVQTTTRADGSYRLTGVSSDANRLQFIAGGAVGGTSATGYGDRCAGGGGSCLDSGADTSVSPGGVRRVNAVLQRAGVIVGRLTDKYQRGIGGVPVELFAGGNDQSGDSFDPVYRSTTSDADGNYSFPQLYPHSWALCFSDPAAALVGTPSSDGYVAKCRPNRVDLASGATATVATTLAGGGAIVGTVVDTDGNPVKGAIVGPATYQLDQPDATSKRDGRFFVAKVPPGTWRLCVSAPRYVPTCSGDAPSVKVVSFAAADVGQIVLQRES